MAALRPLLTFTCAFLLAISSLAGCTDDDDETEDQAPDAPTDTPGTTYAPVPAGARGPAIDPVKGYLVEEIASGLYWVTDGAYQAIFLVSNEGVIVVDAPPNLAAALPAAIAETTTQPVTHVVYSHTHADHIAAAAVFAKPGVEFIAHEATAAYLATQNDPARPVPFGVMVGGGPVPVPTTMFADSMTLNVGQQTLELHYLGPAHEPGNLFIWAPQQKVLMLVDVIFPGWAPFFELALAEDVRAFVAAHDQALSFDFDTFVGGHLTRLGTRADVETQRDYVLDVQANALAALQTVDFSAIAAEVGSENLWLLFGTYLDAVGAECERLTLEDWDRLAAVDVVAASHCAAMVESLRID